MINSTEMPKYKSHKEVWALKIKDISKGYKIKVDGFHPEWGAELIFQDGLHKLVTKEYLDKHKPQVGGYYVQYKGGYESFSPAQDFEEGYTLIAEKSIEEKAYLKARDGFRELDKRVPLSEVLGGKSLEDCTLRIPCADIKFSVNEKHIKPPLGITPKDVYETDAKIERFKSLCGAITRYYDAGLKIKPEWIEEYNELVEIVG